MLIRQLLPAVAAATLVSTLCVAGADADVILADDFADLVDANKTGNTANFGAWDTVAGINAPVSELDFVVGNTTTAVAFHNVTDGEIDVNRNMTSSGWDTSIEFTVLAGQEIDLTSLVLDMRLANGNGGDNNTSSKQGQMIAVLSGSTSGALGTADLGGNIAYPTVEYTRTLDLSSFATLDDSETYTLEIQARGSGFGHHKSLQALELNGDITIVPEPGSMALLGLGGLMMIKRRRRG